MSWSERFVQWHKQQTDCAIHRAFGQFSEYPETCESFGEIVYWVRRLGAGIFDAPVVGKRHGGVDALFHMARYREQWVRPVAEWAGSSASWRMALASLSHHLLGKYPVPAFLSSVWLSNEQAGDRKRWWCIQHSRGVSFRSLDLPIAMTRKMEHLFLASPDHLPIETAMRRAELLALGASEDIVSAILKTRLATDLSDGEFWRSVWMFLIANVRELDMEQIGPLCDFLQAVRRGGSAEDGIVAFGAGAKEFSMKGRTWQSMMRLMRDWHRSLGGGGAGFSWVRTPFHPWVLDEPGREDSEGERRWQMVELTNSSQLRNEGAALHHCVASYSMNCYSGRSSIWSLRVWHGEKMRRVLTVEVNPKEPAVVQARGYANRAASGKSLRILEDWAARERLRMTL